VGKGIWVDGNASEEELQKLHVLLREAIVRARNGTLPMKFIDDKITFKAQIIDGNIVTFYGWNFPPKELWVKENRDVEECLSCWPLGLKKEPAREVWCDKLGYNFPKCPYGVPTRTMVIGG